MALSLRRANAVKDALVREGVPAQAISRITKPRILEAVREAKGDQAAQLLEHLQKAEMAREAERLLDSTGWLPEQTRTTRQCYAIVSAGSAPLGLRRWRSRPELSSKR